MNGTMMYYATDIAVTGAETYFMYFILKNLPKRDSSRLKPLLLYAVHFLSIVFLTEIDTAAHFKLMFMLLLFVFGGSYVYQTTKLSMLFYLIIFAISLLSGEAIGMGIWYFISRNPNAVVMANKELTNLEIVILMKVISFIIIVAAEYMLRNRREFRFRDIYSFLTSGLSSVLILIVVCYNYYHMEDRNLALALFIASVVLSLALIFNTGLISRYVQMKEAEYKREQSLYELRLKNSYYQEKLVEEEKIREIYHDFKNHLLLLEANLGQTDQAKEAIRKLSGKISDYEDFYSTGHEMLDIIIKEKMKTIKKEGIEVQLDVDMQSGSFLELLDISTIFGNLFDNAIEASVRISREDIKKRISLKVKAQNRFLVIKMSNPVEAPDYGTRFPSTKENAEDHGFGIANIRKSVIKYDGECNYGYEGTEFVFRIIIPFPERPAEVY